MLTHQRLPPAASRWKPGNAPAEKHSQYSFRHREFLQLQCFFAPASPGSGARERPPRALDTLCSVAGFGRRLQIRHDGSITVMPTLPRYGNSRRTWRRASYTPQHLVAHKSYQRPAEIHLGSACFGTQKLPKGQQQVVQNGQKVAYSM